MILRPANVILNLDGGGDVLALSLCHFYQLRQNRPCQVPDGHGNETSSRLDFETMDRATVLVHCIPVFLGFDSRHYRCIRPCQFSDLSLPNIPSGFSWPQTPY